jgi:hypothetical protein
MVLDFEQKEEDKIIELSSDLDNDSNNMQLPLQTSSTVYHVNVKGKPNSMPRPTFMSWVHGPKLFCHVVQKGSPKKLEFHEKFACNNSKQSMEF